MGDTYHGEAMTTPFPMRLSNPGFTLVQGGNANPFGHALFRLGDDIGYIHVDTIYDYPHLIPASEFPRYLRENGKFVLRKVDVKLPCPTKALAKIEELRRKKWLWLAMPHNCVAFCEEIINAGGGDWSCLTNLPSFAAQAEAWKREEAPEYAHATMAIDGPHRLAPGQSAEYWARPIGLPAGGSFRWWPAVGDEERGLRVIQAGARQITARATRSGGRSVLTVRYNYKGGHSVGRLEVNLG